MDRDDFKDAAEATKTTCPVSVALLGNVELELDARLDE
jgi:organic hydroperoxide reductase OsmC/OhrA